LNVRRALVILVAALVGVAGLALAPLGVTPAQGEGEPTMAISVTEGDTATVIDVTGSGCFLPDGITGADGVLFQLIAPDGTAAASATLLVERDGTWAQPFTVPNGVPAGEYAVRGTCIAPMYENLGVLTAGTFTVTGEGPPVPEREPATPRFPEDIEPYPAYDGQSTCSPTAKPGMIAYRDMVMDAYPGTASYGISRDCNVGGTSEHKEGRAWDWANDANSATGRRRVQNFFNWLFATDQYGHRYAMARRLGVMYVIWNRQIFRMYRVSDGWTPYTGSVPHTDHVHVSLTRAGGAGRTSFWTMQLGGPGDPPPNNKGPRAEYEATTRTVEGDYDFAERGDFDGNGKLDILWYGQLGKPESIWWGRRGRGFVHADLTARGSFRPLTGDYDGDGRTDILWYAPGAAQDYLWFGRSDRKWDTTKVNIATRYPKSMVGDYDGDGRDDIFWYGPGANAPDRLWFGRADRRFVSKPADIQGDYRTAVGDFDGDHRDDIFWYAPGDTQDYLYFGQSDRTFAVTERTVAFSARPLVADMNGDGKDDLFWYVPGDGKDKVWWARANRAFAPGAVDNVTGSFSPVVTGDFDEDGKDDIFWYQAGGTTTVWWFE
jgi:hypothetical protein